MNRGQHPHGSVIVERSGLLEAEHRIHVSVARDGSELGSLGDSSRSTLLRSAAKPLFGLEFASIAPDLTPAELAVACASHDGGEAAVAAVRSLLSRAKATERDLHCTSNPNERLAHWCSGSHAAMLLLARRADAPIEGYERPGHPVQRRLLAVIGEAVGRPAATLKLAGDNCCLPTAEVTIAEAARAYSRLASGRSEAQVLVCDAIRKHPTLIGGKGSPDVSLMRSAPGTVAKLAAGGLLCVGLPGGYGVALKCEDGSEEGLVLAALALLGIPNETEWSLLDDFQNRIGTIRTDHIPELIPYDQVSAQSTRRV